MWGIGAQVTRPTLGEKEGTLVKPARESWYLSAWVVYFLGLSAASNLLSLLLRPLFAGVNDSSSSFAILILVYLITLPLSYGFFRLATDRFLVRKVADALAQPESRAGASLSEPLT
jgi:hypothetical protein